MKSLLAVVLLLCFLLPISAGPVAPSVPKDGCCPGYTQMRIPKIKVIHAAMTPGDCGDKAKAIVVTTVLQKKICVDPQLKWAKELLAAFQNSTSVP